MKETVLKHPDRPEAERFWNFPQAAIEEAVVNAVYHRSYEIREPVEVRISPEDLVVLSFPGPDRSIRLTDLRAGKAVSRRYRNRRIGEFLKELELTEGRSTGLSKIFRAMAANGSPPPEFDTDEERSYFVLRLPVHPKATAEPAPEVVGETVQKTWGKTPVETSVETPVETLVKTPDLILNVLRKNPEMTLAEAAQAIGKSVRAVERAAAKLVQSGRLRFVGPKKGGHWELDN